MITATNKRLSEVIVDWGHELYGKDRNGNWVFDLNEKKDPKRYTLYQDVHRIIENKPGTWDPRKGAVVVGSRGVGKTSMFRIYQKIYRNFVWSEALKIEDFLKEFGEIETIKKWGYDLKLPLYIDDIGRESREVFLYKNSVSIVGKILEQRYDLWVREGIKTFCSSNLGRDEFKSFYGSWLYDRFLEFMNIIQWNGESLRGR